MSCVNEDGVETHPSIHTENRQLCRTAKTQVFKCVLDV